MRIAVLSGKGGAGKTLVSVNLAAVAPEARYIDCDVEEPNGHLFFRVQNTKTHTVSRCVPVWVQDRCNGCRQCVDFCRFHALAWVNGSLVVFEDLCHACGGCMLLCPANALLEKQKPIGFLYRGTAGNVHVSWGALQPGEASGLPIIRDLLKPSAAHRGDWEMIDCPPGSACSVMESIKEADYCLLVAEPTVFGAHNLAMVHELAALFLKPCGVVLNKCAEGENPAQAYCDRHGLPVLASIPYDAELAKLAAGGSIVADEMDWVRALFEALRLRIREEVCR